MAASCGPLITCTGPGPAVVSWPPGPTGVGCTGADGGDWSRAPSDMGTPPRLDPSPPSPLGLRRACWLDEPDYRKRPRATQSWSAFASASTLYDPRAAGYGMRSATGSEHIFGPGRRLMAEPHASPEPAPAPPGRHPAPATA